MRKYIVLALAALVGFLAGSPARAGLVIALQEAGVNGGAITPVATGADFTSAVFSGTYGDFTLIISGAASQNGASLSDLLGATVSIQNNSSSAKALHIFASQTDYTLPAGSPLKVESGMSGTVNIGTLNGAGVFEAFLDPANTSLGRSAFNNGVQTATFNGSTFDTGSAFGSFNRTGPTYSITSEVSVLASGGGQANFSDQVNVSSVPEPATIVLACMGVPALGWLAVRRRRAGVRAN